MIAIEHPEQIDTEHTLYIMLGQFKSRLHLGDPCIGNHDVQGTESVNRLLDECFDLATLGDVGYDANCFAVKGVDMGNDLGQTIVRALTIGVKL